MAATDGGNAMNSVDARRFATDDTAHRGSHFASYARMRLAEAHNVTSLLRLLTFNSASR
jgi:hypothetical protein